MIANPAIPHPQSRRRDRRFIRTEEKVSQDHVEPFRQGHQERQMRVEQISSLETVRLPGYEIHLYAWKESGATSVTADALAKVEQSSRAVVIGRQLFVQYGVMKPALKGGGIHLPPKCGYVAARNLGIERGIEADMKIGIRGDGAPRRRQTLFQLQARPKPGTFAPLFRACFHAFGIRPQGEPFRPVTDNTFSVSLLDRAADVIARAVRVHDIIVRQVSGRCEQNAGSFSRLRLV
jgi:hypothetical protein